jgi:hypothetical protein
MKTKFISYVWGITLVSLVVLTLACLQGYVAFDQLLGWKSFTIFTCLSALSFISYFFSGLRKWAWLFPALFFAALALNAAGIFNAYGTPIVAFPILISFAIPFYVGYIVDRKQWAGLIPAWILTLLALIPALVPLIDESLLIALLLFSISLPFMVGSLSNPECRWAGFVAVLFEFVGVIYMAVALINGVTLGRSLLLITIGTFFILLIIGALTVTDIILKMKVPRQLSS